MAYIRSLKEELIDIRRDLHRYPEVLFDVDRTAAKVAAYLTELGLDVREGVGKHFGKGVIGTLDSGRPGPVIVLRADMDALAIREENTFEHRSRNEGAMHACGHDAHTAMLLGAAKALARFREQWRGTVRFVFQPAEESALPSPLDGRMISGGKDMIEDGALAGADYAFALHVQPSLPVGTLGIHRRESMAASTHFRIAFQGLNGHHSTPHLAVDALSMAAQFVTDVKIAVATELDPMQPAVFAFGTLHAGTAINAIAGESELSGTYRVFRTEDVDKLHRVLETRAAAIAGAYGGGYTSQYRLGTPLINDPAAVELSLRAGRRILGEGNVVVLEKPSLAGEDFALYLREVPGAFAFLGVADPARETMHPVHHPLFDLDESALPLGAGMFLQWVREASEEPNVR
ncbi:amidohydrolase [Cohnella fermenti]|uniref:Amidohydrolase n=2 Tax=Cohnella fermenti TaxID=2565925 RepID=A0A4S4BRS8_9BACL|nr:amidohydrolase [Cohnella fermenti]